MRPTLATLYPPHEKARLVDAVKLRTSCRAYAGAPDAADLAALSYALGRYRLPGARIELLPVEEGFFTSTMLGMKRITGCRMIAALIITNDPLSRIHAGILGESLVLEATSRGLGSCWVTGSFRRKELRITLPADEALLCVIALGKPAAPLVPPTARHRKSPEHFCQGGFQCLA